MISIVTATYKRSQKIYDLAQSLGEQTSQNFEWIIVIDDDSKEEKLYYKNIISKIINDFPFLQIKYIFKSNGGKHTCINTAMQFCEGDFIFVVDDDDQLVEQAIATINEYILKYDDNNISSFWFTQKDSKGNVIGQNFEHDVMVDNYVNILVNSNGIGDKKAVYKTEIRKKFLYPEYHNENFLGESTLHIKINAEYSSVFINCPIYVSDYLKGGLTDLGVKNRLSNPNGGLANSIAFLNNPKINHKNRIKKAILADVYAIKLGLNFFDLIKLIEIKKILNYFLLFFSFPLAYIFIRKNS